MPFADVRIDKIIAIMYGLMCCLRSNNTCFTKEILAQCDSALVPSRNRIDPVDMLDVLQLSDEDSARTFQK